MACGVPGIGTNIGGIPEVIQHGENGYIVELGDYEEAAKYAIDLLLDEHKLQQFRENAIFTANHHFHSSKIVDQYESLYERVARKHD
jgi:Glycosyltransferase